jgi:hypothetical protein
VKYIDPDGKAPGESIFGLSLDPWGDFNNLLGSVLGNLAAFFGNKTAQQNLTVTGRYYLQEFDKANIAALSTVSEASSNASFFFLAIGQPEAAAGATALSVAADSLIVFHDFMSGWRNGDNDKINNTISQGTFVVAGLLVGEVVAGKAEKLLTINAGGKNMSYVLNGNSWGTIKQKIYNDYGKMLGDTVSKIMEGAKKVYDAAQKE